MDESGISPSGGSESDTEDDSTPPAVPTSRTALNGGAKDRVKEAKKRRHFIKVKDMSQPLLHSAKESISKQQQQPTVAPPSEVTSAGSDVPTGAAEGKTSCPDYFGVKSYLHNFYESVSVKNPDLYEELEGGDYRYLIRPKKPRCRSLWWKTAVWTGVHLLVAGVIVILVGYLVPRRPVLVGFQDDLEVVDRSALSFNYTLDVCKLVGLVVFCVGGTVVAIALLFPSFLYNYCDEDWTLYAEPFKLGTSTDEIFEPQSPTEKQVPATEELTRIQPEWSSRGGGTEVAEAPVQQP